jgi:hypothetical protein
MLSRVADALYWMGRYLERSENLTRLLLVTEDISSETQGLAEQVAQSSWKDLLAIFPSSHVGPPASAFAPMSMAYLAGFYLDAGNPYSVHYSLRRARENARSVREALTVEVFLALNETFRALEAHARRGLSDPPSFRDALDSTHKGLFTSWGHRAHVHARSGAGSSLKLGESLERIYRTCAASCAPSCPACRAEPRADVALYTRSGARRAAGAGLCWRTTGVVRRPAGAGAGRAVPRCSIRTAALRCGTGWKRRRTAGAHRGRWRADGGGCADRDGCTPISPNRTSGWPGAGPTPRSSSAW